MSDLIKINGKDVAFKTENSTVFTDSRTIAEVFGKRHADVIRIIKQKEHLFGQRNFAQSSYINSQNKEQPMYLLDRDFFSFIVMGFTGSKADEWKLLYIKAFNEMEKRLTQPKELTTEDLLKLTSERLAESEQRAVQAEKLLEQAKIIAKATEDSNETYSIDEFCKIISSKLENVNLGRTRCYILLRALGLVELKSTRPLQSATKIYLDYRKHDYGYSTRVYVDKADQLIKLMIKHLQSNKQLNSALGYPMGDI